MDPAQDPNLPMPIYTFAPAPTISDLTRVARALRPGSANSVWNWICTGCEKTYGTEKHLLGDVPPYGCEACKILNPTGFSMKITESTIFDVGLDVPIYDQGNTNTCAAHASTTVVKISCKVKAAQKRATYSAPLDPVGLAGSYCTRWAVQPGHEERICKATGVSNIPLVLHHAKVAGIPLKGGVLDDPTEVEMHTQRISNMFQVNPGNALHITRLLANGIPLVATARSGSLMPMVGAGEIYLSPTDNCGAIIHAVALIGYGLHLNPLTRRVEIYYHVRDSHGPATHPKYSGQGLYGGDFAIWASDILEAWGVYVEELLGEEEDSP